MNSRGLVFAGAAAVITAAALLLVSNLSILEAGAISIAVALVVMLLLDPRLSDSDDNYEAVESVSTDDAGVTVAEDPAAPGPPGSIYAEDDEPAIWGEDPVDAVDPAAFDDTFKADITIIAGEEGGRFSGFGGAVDTDFQFNDGSIPGQIILPEGSKRLEEGQTAQVGIELTKSHRVIEGEQFTIRTGGRTIGYGEIKAPSSPAILNKSGSPEDEVQINKPEFTPSLDVPEGIAAASNDELLPENNADTIGFYFATCRKATSEEDGWFGAERAPENTYGAAAVHVPPERKFGSLKRPFKLSVFSLKIYEQKENPSKHFMVEQVEAVSLEDWRQSVSEQPGNEALIFVHGFNTTFEDSVFRAGQIFWDLKYDGVRVLFSWASAGEVRDYVYDQGSALVGATHFRTLLNELAVSGITDVKIIAHSMGNYMLVDALHGHMDELGSASIKELMMAAPDVDQDHFIDRMPALCEAIPGLTLYASKYDKALLASMELAGGVARAGYVTGQGPVLVEGIDTIDVSEIGEEIFGLGHGAFASRPSVLNDIALIINSGSATTGQEACTTARSAQSGSSQMVAVSGLGSTHLTP
jgi:esterase/lipase superfamily enzyme